MSIKVSHVCGQCRSSLAFAGKFDRAGNLVEAPVAGARPKAPGNSYRAYVQQQFATVKSSHPPGESQGGGLTPLR